MKSVFIYCSLFILFSFQNALAESWKKDSIYWVSYHFTDYAFNKSAPIDKVVVHTGVLREPEPLCRGRGFKTSPYWEDEDWLPMNKNGNHFFIKKRFHSSTGPCQSPAVGPITQYWVYFTDGDVKITEPVLVRLSSVVENQSLSAGTFWSTISKIDAEFQRITDAWETAGKVIHWERAE